MKWTKSYVSGYLVCVTHLSVGAKLDAGLANTASNVLTAAGLRHPACICHVCVCLRHSAQTDLQMQELLHGRAPSSLIGKIYLILCSHLDLKYREDLL